jgi:putative Ca2+/H+ antiporter (TMEM165/GDT1 family)
MPAEDLSMEAILVSIGAVALAEMGDKTQLLAFILASRYQKPVPIILGILAATIFNHGLAGALGAWITSVISPEVLRWILAGSFVAMAAWILVPDKADDLNAESKKAMKLFGVFGLTFVTFFLAEMGDKTQIATVALAANYGSALLVVIGTTIGMLIADVPAVFIGDKLSGKLPLKWLRIASAVVFLGVGLATAFTG